MTSTSATMTPPKMTMRERAATMQTTRAGIVSRLTADAIDLVVITVLYFFILVGWATVVYLATSKSFALPNPAPRFDAIALFVLQVIYLTIGWSGPRRTVGKALLGLRVVRTDGGLVSVMRGFVRAFVCALIGLPLLLWAAVSKRNAALYDLPLKTAVIYDWRNSVQ
jgi:uncharacterized RDD family membrane protein YckC